MQRNENEGHLVNSVNEDFCVDNLLHPKGFTLSKWASNSKKVRETFSESQSSKKLSALDLVIMI